MKCSECGEILLGRGGMQLKPKDENRRYEVVYRHYIIPTEKRLCEECFYIWWYGISYKKIKKTCELKREILKLEEEMRKGIK